MTVDVLSEVLRSLRSRGTVYFCDRLIPPWTKEYDGDAVASFHQIRRGSCWLHAEGAQHYLGQGDIVFLAPGTAHVLSGEVPENHLSDAAPETLLLCGYCEFDESFGTPLSDLLPRFSIIRNDRLQPTDWLRTTLDRMSSEYLSMQPGSKIVVDKLTEVLLVELIRANFGQAEQTPLLRALADKQIGDALRRLHENPARAWSLESLADAVGLSRSGFAKRFKTLTGYAMFDYLTQLRMQRACVLLEETSLSLYQVANRVGYASDLAFTRTFKKRTGQTPTVYRREHRALEAENSPG